MLHSISEFAFLFKFKIVLPNYIQITSNGTEAISSFLAQNQFNQVFIIVDEHTEEYCLPLIIAAFPSNSVVIRIASGEANKNLDTCSIIWNTLTEANADRQALLVNLGGGVITDMGGFCASTYKRGVAFVNMPTTLLSQVDASIGGKLGIDFSGFKNHIGLFQIPDKVIIDPVFLKTLPIEEIRSGFAEVIKHNLIANGNLYEVLKNVGFEKIHWLQWIESSLEIKNKIVEEDPQEAGVRKLLNFGHTIGHAIESHYLDSESHLRHGEAIAVGMIAESFLSTLKTGLSDKELHDVTDYLISIYGWRHINENDFGKIVRLTIQDKKNTNNQVNCVLLESIGRAVYDVVIKEGEIISSLNYYNSLSK